LFIFNDYFEVQKYKNFCYPKTWQNPNRVLNPIRVNPFYPLSFIPFILYPFYPLSPSFTPLSHPQSIPTPEIKNTKI
jgi:hypothetical protein